MVTEQKKRTIVGTVVSDKMDKTITVLIERTKLDPVVKKVVRSHKKYKVHDEQEQARIGDVVEIYEGRPMSKTKYMYLDKVVRSVATSHE